MTPVLPSWLGSNAVCSVGGGKSGFEEDEAVSGRLLALDRGIKVEAFLYGLLEICLA